MGKMLNEIAMELKNNSKVQLIYAFNGTGKTRLSREFKELISPKNQNEEVERKKILYYNAFTEDLFSWKNDEIYKLQIKPNFFTNWILETQGQDKNIINYFHRYINNKLIPKFNSEYRIKDNEGKEKIIEAYTEVTFSYTNNDSDNIKISKSEESCFIWSIFYSLLNEVVEELNIVDLDKKGIDQFNELQYIFIDDPVSSLDDNHLIELAVNLSELIKSSKSDLKFVITTHNILFYNILYSELNNKKIYMLIKDEDGTYDLKNKNGSSNKSFSYHNYLRETIKEAIRDKKIEKYHFTLLRNLYEKTANFLGYEKWSELLPEDKETYANRIMHFYSHRTLPNEEISEPTESEKKTVEFLFNHLLDNAKFWKEK